MGDSVLWLDQERQMPEEAPCRVLVPKLHDDLLKRVHHHRLKPNLMRMVMRMMTTDRNSLHHLPRTNLVTVTVVELSLIHI